MKVTDLIVLENDFYQKIRELKQITLLCRETFGIKKWRWSSSTKPTGTVYVTA